MSDRIEQCQQAGHEYFTVWKTDSKGFPIALYEAETEDQAIERLNEAE